MRRRRPAGTGCAGNVRTADPPRTAPWRRRRSEPSAYYLSFTPLAATRAGREAVLKYGLPPFIDGSCRREPDFESVAPSVSCLCRFHTFAPHRIPGDVLVYVTNLCAVVRGGPRERRLVAVLKVLSHFESHREAAAWYTGKGLPPPANCMVAGNPPLPWDKTHARAPPECTCGGPTPAAVIRCWDRIYRARATSCGDFLVCDALFRELCRPPLLTYDMLLEIRTKVPRPQTALELSRPQLSRLLESCMPDRAPDVLAGVAARAD